MNLKNINFNFIFQFTAILSLIIVYSAGRVAQDHGMENTYKFLLQQKVQEEVIGFQLADKQVLIYNHIPYLIPVLSLLIIDNYITSFTIWTLIMISAYSTAIIILINTIQVEKHRFLLFITTFLFFPLFQSLLLGQDTALLFLGCVVWYSGMIKQKSWLAAIGLALTSIRPHLFLVFAIPFVLFDLKIRWKLILCVGLLVLISLGVLGWQGILDFLSILQISAIGGWYGFNQSAMFNFMGFISRNLPFLDSSFIHILSWVGYVSTIVFLCFIWKKKIENITLLVCLAISLSLFFAPHLHYHDLTLLIIPMLLLLKKHRNNTNIILGISLALLLLKLLYYILPYVLYIYLSLKIKNSARYHNKPYAN